MKVQVRRFSVHQTAKVVAIIAMVVTFVFMLPVVFLTGVFTSGGETDMAGFGLGMLFFMPIMQAIFVYLSTAVGLLIYNRVSSGIGGIEFLYEPANEPGQETVEG